MSFSIGIIGLPNVGKSTLFKALTKKQVDISNYPFTTIEPNVGVVAVPDERLEKLAGLLKPEKVLPTHIEFVDIAGLVKNAHQGEGLGNQFLSHIREVKAIIHVVRIFSDKNVSHISGLINPEEDLATVNLELVMADLATVSKKLAEVTPKANSGEKEAIAQKPILEKIKNHLDDGKLVNTLVLPDEEKDLIKELHLLTNKPVIHVLNVEEERRQQDFQLKTDYPLQTVTFSAKLEAELADLSAPEIRELGYQETGLDKLIKSAYRLLNLITFFTTQSHILQAWTISQGTTAQEAAGEIHTDFAEGFIKADVINWQKLIEVGSEKNARDQGLIKTVSRDYPVQDGDVLKFKIKS